MMSAMLAADPDVHLRHADWGSALRTALLKGIFTPSELRPREADALEVAWIDGPLFATFLEYWCGSQGRGHRYDSERLVT